MTGVFTDHPDAATTPNDPTFLTHFLCGRSYLHLRSPKTSILAWEKSLLPYTRASPGHSSIPLVKPSGDECVPVRTNMSRPNRPPDDEMLTRSGFLLKFGFLRQDDLRLRGADDQSARASCQKKRRKAAVDFRKSSGIIETGCAREPSSQRARSEVIRMRSPLRTVRKSIAGLAVLGLFMTLVVANPVTAHPSDTAIDEPPSVPVWPDPQFQGLYEYHKEFRSQFDFLTSHDQTIVGILRRHRRTTPSSAGD